MNLDLQVTSMLMPLSTGVDGVGIDVMRDDVLTASPRIVRFVFNHH